jgi:hypothetical protein
MGYKVIFITGAVWGCTQYFPITPMPPGVLWPCFLHRCHAIFRCAGPEDLVTAERIWNNVKDMGDISGPFKEQMWIFMGELKEFFNAVSAQYTLLLAFK